MARHLANLEIDEDDDELILEKIRKVIPEELRILFYGIVIILGIMVMRLLFGMESYLTTLLAPMIILYGLAKRSWFSWYVSRWIMYSHGVLYLFFFAKGTIWYGLQWMSREDVLIFWLVAAIGLFVGAGNIGKCYYLFASEKKIISSWKKYVLILVSCSLMLLPALENIGVTYLDPRVLSFDNYVAKVALNQDGTKVAVVVTRYDGIKNVGDWVIVRDRQSYSYLQEIVKLNYGPTMVHFDPQGQYLWIAGHSRNHNYNPLSRWSLTEHVLLQSEPDSIPWEESRIQEFRFIPHSEGIAFIRTNGKPNKTFLEIMDINNGQLQNRRSYAADDNDESSMCIGVSGDGRYLFSKTWADNPDKTGKYKKIEMLTMWDIETGERIKAFPIRSGTNEGIACSSDSKFLYIATNSDDKTLPAIWGRSHQGIIDMRDLASGAICKSYVRKNGDDIEGMELSPDGRYLAVCYRHSDRVYLLDANTLEEVDYIKGPVIKGKINAITFSGDGNLLAIASGKHVKIYNVGR